MMLNNNIHMFLHYQVTAPIAAAW